MLKEGYAKEMNNNIFRRFVNTIKKEDNVELPNEENEKMVEELEKTVDEFAKNNNITFFQAINILSFYK